MLIPTYLSALQALKLLRELPYEDYLKTHWWRRYRELRIEYAQNKCDHCEKAIYSGKGRKTAHVHHKYYTTKCGKGPGGSSILGREFLCDTEALCAGCHKDVHYKQLDILDDTPSSTP